MPLLHAIVIFFLFGSSTGLETEEICYGNTYKLPFRYTPPVFKGKLHFTPNNGGSPKLLMENGEAKDPRIKVSTARVSFTDVKENDGGRFSISSGRTNEGLDDVIMLRVLDCAEHVMMYYGFDWYIDAPEQSELLDFTPDNDMGQSKVLWNRTNPRSNKGGRGKMWDNNFQMLDLTQSDNGFYNFRKQDGIVLKRIQLLVKGFQRHHDASVDGRLVIEYPVSDYPWTLTFTSMKYNYTITLMKAGNMVRGEHSHRFNRISQFDDGIEINPVEIGDSGTYNFIDSHGNLAKTVQVDVDNGFLPTYVYVCVIVGIILVVIVCCCCVKKRCCKKSSTKREGSAPQTAAAPAVYYHGVNQPAVFNAAPTTNYSHQPDVSPAPATTSSGPSVYNPVNVYVDPHQPEVVASGGQGVTPAPSAGSEVLSTDPGPRFELKGMSYPSAPPLSSDTSHLSDVYNSDKLNFL